MRRRRRSRLLLAALLLLGLLVGAELALRWLGVTGEVIGVQSRHQAQWLREGTLRRDLRPGLFYSNAPDVDLTLGGVRYHHDQQGRRLDDVEIQPDAVRVPFLGDSTCYGLGVDGDETLPAAITRALDGAIAPLNLGVCGYGTPQELATYRAVRHQLGDAPVVVLVLFPNDTSPAFWRWDADQALLYYDPLPVPESWAPLLWDSALYRGIASLVSSRQHANGHLDPLQPDNIDWALGFVDELAAEVRADGRELLVVHLPQMVPLDPYDFEDQRQRLRAAFARRDLPFVDCLDAFLAYRAKVAARREERTGEPVGPQSLRTFLHTYWVHEDDQHPDGRAYAIAARPVADALGRLLGL